MKLYAIMFERIDEGTLTIYADAPGGIRVFRSPEEAQARVVEVFGPQPRGLRFHVVTLGESNGASLSC